MHRPRPISKRQCQEATTKQLTKAPRSRHPSYLAQAREGATEIGEGADQHLCWKRWTAIGKEIGGGNQSRAKRQLGDGGR